MSDTGARIGLTLEVSYGIRRNNAMKTPKTSTADAVRSTDWLGRIRGLHGKLASAAGISKCRVKCEKCGREQDVDGAKALARGWPECHGYTMTLLRPNVPDQRPGAKT